MIRDERKESFTRHAKRSLIALGVALSAMATVRASDLPSPSPAPERIFVPTSTHNRPSESLAGRSGDGLSSRRFDFDRFRSRIEDAWQRRKGFLESDQESRAQSELDQIRDLCHEAGVERLTPLAAALLHEGDEDLAAGDFNKARKAYEGALNFSSDLSQAQAGLAAVAWKSGEGPLPAARLAISAMISSAREGWYGFRSLANGLLLLLYSLALFATFFAAALVLRHMKPIRHDIEESLIGRVTPELLAISSLAVVLSPLISWILAPWLGAIWLAMAYRYGSVKEKTVSFILLIGLVILGPLSVWTESLCRLGADPSSETLLNSANGSYDPDSIVELENLSAEHPKEPLYSSLLGTVYARGQFFDEARDQFRRSAELVPHDPRPHNNIGNLYFRLGRYAEACQAYRRAIELDPSYLPPYANLYLARQAVFAFREAEDSLQQGRRVNPAGISALLDETRREGRDQEPIDSVLTRSEIWSLLLSGGSQGTRSDASPISGFLSKGSVIASMCLLIVALSALVPRRKMAVACVRCGLAFCHRCQAKSEAPDHCVQCRYLFVKREILHPVVRKEKMAAIAKQLTRRSRAGAGMQLVMPGAGWILAGATISGTMVLAIWSMLGSWLILRRDLIVGPLREAMSFVEMLLVVVCCATIWIGSNLKGFSKFRTMKVLPVSLDRKADTTPSSHPPKPVAVEDVSVEETVGRF